MYEDKHLIISVFYSQHNTPKVEWIYLDMSIGRQEEDLEVNTASQHSSLEQGGLWIKIPHCRKKSYLSQLCLMDNGQIINTGIEEKGKVIKRVGRK